MYDRRSSVQVDKQPLATTFSHALGGYRFTLPLTGLKRGLAYAGPAVRLRHLLGRMARARNGTTFNVGVVGGRCVCLRSWAACAAAKEGKQQVHLCARVGPARARARGVGCDVMDRPANCALTLHTAHLGQQGWTS